MAAENDFDEREYSDSSLSDSSSSSYSLTAGVPSPRTRKKARGGFRFGVVRLNLITKAIILIILALIATWIIFLIIQELDNDEQVKYVENLMVREPAVPSGGDQSARDDFKVNESGVIQVPESIKAIDSEALREVGVTPLSPEDNESRMTLVAPTQSLIIDESELPSESVNIIVTEQGFEPDTFYVSAGQEITLALTARTNSPAVLTFYDARMAAVAIGCGPGDTRFVVFNAPSEVGEYFFINDVSGKREQQGRMVVR